MCFGSLAIVGHFAVCPSLPPMYTPRSPAGWASDLEYVFFRNYMPNRDKLRTKLIPSTSSAVAYCCQCCWLTVGGDGWSGSQVPPKPSNRTLSPSGTGGVVQLTTPGGAPSAFAVDASVTSWVCGGHA